ncbi:SDR family NAD(P)-dependent oxidoreductase [Neokomagataea thailandica]|uniref:Oxidoreductase n=1 Tax=Neokomagataea tanensis NBRC 106556 TaxID=1223519 RepID=A0ABQ0QK96_9PROT|nr:MULTISPECIES: SDR family NAD(P)-dependent oxidoreductase [Neokomagataea]GBR47766.1 oxidoreductase [Neokomagataea tanensis NBRC 106556]
MQQTPQFSSDTTLITGASSGIGEALAMLYAQPGAHLILWGRSPTRLAKVAKNAAQRGATTECYSLDLTETNTALEQLRHNDTQTPISRLILAAGLGDIRKDGALTEAPSLVHELCLVNFTTPATLATEMADRMAKRGGGEIAFLGSVAAFHDLPMSTAYSGSKAGLARFSTALHAAMAPHHVSVTLISPGYVDTPMSQRLSGHLPFLVSPDKAAQKIKRAIARKKIHLIFPWPFAVFAFLESHLPRPIVHRLLRLSNVQQTPRDSKSTDA